MTKATLGAALLAVALFSSCGGAEGANDAASGQETTTATVPPAVEPEHDAASLERSRSVVLEAGDVPDRWVDLGEDAVDDVDDSIRRCLGTDPGIGEKGKHVSGFAYTDEAGGVQSIIAQVRVYDTVESADRVMEAWAQEGLPGCLVDVLVEETGMSGTMEHSEISEDEVALSSEFEQGSAAIAMDLVLIRDGDTIAQVRGTSMGQPIPDEAMGRAVDAMRRAVAET